jgi:beta-galactosidase
MHHKRPAPFDRFWFGAAYYPEHWDEQLRATDPVRMAEAGFNIVRLAEFAWDLMEPQEGRYDFGLFDQTIARLGQHGIHTILCTPTATPPRWLTVAHPEVLRVNADGVPLQHGSRQHPCVSSPVFRDYSRRITQAMADHFRDNPHVVGWQTDNELYCHFSECHCPSCQRAFAEFLCRKFNNDIGALNRAWGTAFWAQTYAGFADVPTPRPQKPTYCNPAHQLDYYRFLSDTVARFQHEQIVILRAAQPRWWITHNGIMDHVDYRGQFTRDLDVLGYDCYPMFCNDPVARPAIQAHGLDATRAWSGNFIIPEQQSGPGGQAPYFQDHPEPGELRKMTYASIARGADSLLYFRWRSCRFGAEEYWCGILDHDNVPRRRYAEVKQIGAELRRLGPALRGTHVHADAVVAGDDRNVMNAHRTLPFGLPSPNAIAGGVYRQLFERGFATGVIHPADNLDGVKLYVIPHWVLFDPAWVAPLERFARRGGTLILGARTATRDLNNNVVPETIPGCLRALAGLTVEEYGRQNAPDQRPLSFRLAGKTIRSEWWYEILQPDRGTQTLAKWQSRHLAGTAAICYRPVGKGRVIYVGTYLTEPVVAALVKLAGLKPLWPGVPRRVEVVRRQDNRRQLWFFLNHNDRPVTIARPPQGEELLTGKVVKGALKLPANGVAVVHSTARQA